MVGDGLKKHCILSKKGAALVYSKAGAAAVIYAKGIAIARLVRGRKQFSPGVCSKPSAWLRVGHMFHGLDL